MEYLTWMIVYIIKCKRPQVETSAVFVFVGVFLDGMGLFLRPLLFYGVNDFYFWPGTAQCSRAAGTKQMGPTRDAPTP